SYEELEKRIKELELTVSENELIKDALQDSKKQFQLLYERAPMSYQSLDQNGNFIEVNKAWSDILGYSRQEVIGRSFGDFLHPDWQDHFKKNFPKFKAVGEVLGVEFNMIKKSGECILVSFHGKIGKDEKGNFQQTHCIFQDITAKRRAQEELLKQQMILRKAQEIAHIGSWDLDIENNVLIWSDENYRIFGIPTGTRLTYENFLNCVHPEDKKYVDKKWKEALNQKIYDIEQRLLIEGRVKWVREKAELRFNKNGECTGATGFTHDITERYLVDEKIRMLNRELEQRVAQRTRQLQDINEELEDFVYSVSHDLRAPLRSVSGFAEIINRRHKACLNEEGQHYFENIIKAGRQMGVLIDDLLKFSRLGRNAIKSESLILDDIFNTVMETLADQIKNKNAKINLPLQMPVVNGDLTLMTHIFINIVENALKYSKEEEPPLIDVSFELEEQYITIAIADNGIGIEPEYHQKIFKIFQRLHGQEKYHGTGIGLAAVKKGVQLMGGEIRVESQPGIGSVFKIKLPAYVKGRNRQ
ncbi:MAG: PAS domain S-box protein, partial [Desulfamplus sp.]|nr:PAS domain S-box protein [Desulfamplus sp.]